MTNTDATPQVVTPVSPVPPPVARAVFDPHPLLFDFVSPQVVAIIVAPIIGVSLAIFAILIWRLKRTPKVSNSSSRTEEGRAVAEGLPGRTPPSLSRATTMETRPPPKTPAPVRGYSTRQSYYYQDRDVTSSRRNNPGPLRRQSTWATNEDDDDDDEKRVTVVIRAVLSPAEICMRSPSEADASSPRSPPSRFAARQVPAGGAEGWRDALGMNPVILPGRGPPSRHGSTHWPLA